MHKITYGEREGNLLAYEKNHMNRYSNEDKNKYVSFNITRTKEEGYIEEINCEGMDLMNH